VEVVVSAALPTAKLKPLVRAADLGFRLLSFPTDRKGPNEKGWQHRVPHLFEVFHGSQNYGTMTGHEIAPGRFLVDVDLDWQPGIPVASCLLALLPTQARAGRPSKRLSHLFYTTAVPLPSKNFYDIDNQTMLVELRGTTEDGGPGKQTMIPPSVHPPTGETLAWLDGDAFEPADVDATTLKRTVTLGAVAMLLLKHLEDRGLVHGCRLPLAGFLLKAGLNEHETLAVGEALATATHNNVQDMTDVVTSTVKRLAQGKRVEGKAALSKALGADGPALVERMLEWIGTDAATSGPQASSGVTDLIRLAQDSAELFASPEGDYYAIVPVNGHRETMSLRGKSFRAWLAQAHYERTGRGVNGSAVADAVMTLEGCAKAGGQRFEVYTRVAAVGDRVYLDLGRDDHHVLTITAQGWMVGEPAEPVRFVRRKAMLPLPDPTRGRSISELLPTLVNVAAGSDELKLIVGWLVGALRGRKPFPILILTGEQGSAKSGACRLLRRVIDPNQADLRSTPREVRDLMIAAQNAHVIGFDNLSGVADWLSDALCALATGNGFSTRLLTTDSDEMIFSAARPVVMNGITELAGRADLADRAIVVTLEPIDDGKRLTEREVEERFLAAQPELLGALADAVAQAIRGPVTLARMPRMADFAVTVESAAPALGWTQGGFLTAYEACRADTTDRFLDGDVVASALERMAMEDESRPWVGTSDELRSRLADLTHADRRDQLPRSAKGLVTALKRLAPALRAHGIDVQLPKKKREGKDTRRLMRVQYPKAQTALEFEVSR
jgi:hypothetical protein